MRLFALMAAFALVSIPVAQAGEPRSLSLAGVDEKLPGALGKAAEAPKVVEAPKPPDPVTPPAPPQAVAAPPPAAAAPPADPAPAAQPAFVPRPSLAAPKPDDKAGQVTYDDSRPPPVAAPPKQAKAEKPRRKRAHWDEARIMREIYRYSGYAGMIGGW